MVWKNWESGKPWLVGLWVSRVEKCTIFLPTRSLFFSFLRHHCGLTTYLEILNFLLSNVILRVVLNYRILHIATAWKNSYQILRWIMSKLASREVLGKMILFFSRIHQSKEVKFGPGSNYPHSEKWKLSLVLLFFCVLLFFLFYLLKCLFVITYMSFW